ncbi:MAG: RsmF rRNA methyltransferase first C-terminal domain-containing protein [Clostridiales bacterium]|nr:RsmF rRNA methyltransferase first C-terminal domain-containing protein [Clostridiales bacterium]
MFRRDPNAVKSWERFGPDTCMPIQEEILECAHLMLRSGGELVYSTCTFFEGEDEEQIIKFMERHSGYKVISHPEISGVTSQGEDGILPGSMRIWPHLSRGDGHFCVHLKKSGDEETETFSLEKLPSYKNKRDDNYGFGKSREAYISFLKEILKDPPKNIDGFLMHREKIHILPVNERLFDGLKTVKLGMFPGEIKLTTTERLFIPSHSLALTLRQEDIREDSLLRLSRDDERLIRYLKGETIISDDSTLKNKGHVIISVDGYPLGFGKISGDGSVKNMYPKAWRLL